ncbi:MAG: hypothetical protein JG718_10315 [Candidatus Thiothrix moscowensis]|nr:hypothetical protein [Candidatus Thiothrix moscowensis]
MATVYISQEYSSLVDLLASQSTQEAGQPIFKTNMDLFVFAALLGQNLDENHEIFKVKNAGKEIPDRIFTNNNMDGAIYLLALHAKKNGDILREVNDSQCWKIVEQYAAHGFQEIRNWFLDAPGSSEVDVILNKMKEEARALITEEGEIDTSKITF